MEQNYLNNLFVMFTDKIISRHEIEGLIYNYLLKNQRKTTISAWKRDEYEDFLSWFYPRLSKAVDSYRDINIPFEAFIYSVLRLASKEYRNREIINSVIEYSAWSVHIPDMYASEEAPAYSAENKEQVIKDMIIDQSGRKNTRSILALILKCYYHVSDDFLCRIAEHIEFDKELLLSMVNKLRALRQKRDDDIYFMRERIYCQFHRCIIFEKRLSYVNENSAAYIKLSGKLKKARIRLEKMRNRLNSIRTDATNNEIAKVIGVSKGTVDASLHKLRSRWEMLAEKSHLN